MSHFVWDPNPVLFSLGPLQLRWYGLLFTGGFLVGFYIMQWMYKRENKDTNQLDRLLIYIFAGAVIGARLGHCLFYEPDYYLAHPLEILMIWKGGLASHGGTVGMLIACYFFLKHTQDPFLYFVDRLSIPIAFGSMCIRLGNFFNSEILGIVTTSPFAIIFAKVGPEPRHPAQLYEAAAYLFTFLLLLFLYKRKAGIWANGFLIGTMFITIFGLRFLIECIKVEQADYVLDMPLNVGHLLSIPFIVLGIYFIYVSRRNTLKETAQ